MKEQLHGRHLLTMKHHTPAEVEYLVDLAAELKRKKKAGERGHALDGKNIALIFEKPSTRTRCAFTVAAFNEGGHSEYLGRNDIQLGHKEDVKDTARVLGRMFDGIEFRGFSQKTVEDLAKYSGAAVWNGLTDEYHPTQILADFLTIKENFGRLKGIKLVFMGDGRNNMANSLMIGAAKCGLHFVVCAPEALHTAPELVAECRKIAEDDKTGAVIEIISEPKEAVKDADVIYTDVWASMGEEAQYEERKKLLAPYQVNMELIKATGKAETIFLHCLPAVKGSEVTEEVLEAPFSRVFDEAENRLHTIKAVMVASIGNY